MSPKTTFVLSLTSIDSRCLRARELLLQSVVLVLH